MMKFKKEELIRLSDVVNNIETEFSLLSESLGVNFSNKKWLLISRKPNLKEIKYTLHGST